MNVPIIRAGMVNVPTRLAVTVASALPASLWGLMGRLALVRELQRNACVLIFHESKLVNLSTLIDILQTQKLITATPFSGTGSVQIHRLLPPRKVLAAAVL